MSLTEIRNPMTVIKGYVQWIQRKSSPALFEQFKTVLDEVDRVNNITTAFLSIARNQYVEKEIINLNNVMKEIAPLLEAEAIRRNININISQDPLVPDMFASKEELKQLILNISINALQAIGCDGSLTIDVNTNNNEVFVAVEDSGCGIEQDELDKIFEPFYTTKTDGTGLGLAICKSIVERHGGKVEISSTVGVGTRVVVIFKPHFVTGNT